MDLEKQMLKAITDDPVSYMDQLKKDKALAKACAKIALEFTIEQLKLAKTMSEEVINYEILELQTQLNNLK